MLYFAAHMEEDGEISAEAAKQNPDLLKYGRSTFVKLRKLNQASFQLFRRVPEY